MCTNSHTHTHLPLKDSCAMLREAVHFAEIPGRYARKQEKTKREGKKDQKGLKVNALFPQLPFPMSLSNSKSSRILQVSSLHLHLYMQLFIKHLLLLYWLCQAFDCVDHNKLWKILKEMGIPDQLTCLLRNLYAGQEATVRTGHGTTDWFQIGKGVLQGCILPDLSKNPAYLTYIQSTSWEVLGWMKRKLESRFLREI